MTMPENDRPDVEEQQQRREEEDEDELEIPSEFICPITQEIMQDPVMSRYGHSYEREAILKWLIRHNDCPMSRQPLKLSDLLTNHNLRARILQWQKDNEQDIVVVCSSPGVEDLLGYFFLAEEDLQDATERSDDDENPVVEVRRTRDLRRSSTGRRRRRRQNGNSNTDSASARPASSNSAGRIGGLLGRLRTSIAA